MATVTFLYRSVKSKANLSLRFLYRDNKTPSTVLDRKTKEPKQKPYTDFVLNSKTKIEISKEYWNQKNKRNASAEIKNQKLIIDAELNKIETHLLNSFNRDIEVLQINKEWLEKELESYYNPKKLPVEAYYLKYWIDHIINTAHKRTNAKKGIGLSPNTIKGYKGLKNVINRYQTLENTKVLSLTVKWFEDFFEWLKFTENYSHNTAVNKITILKSVINTSSKKIEVPKNLNDLEIKAVDTYDDDTDVVALTIKELEIIETVKLESLSLINARKWLLLSCWTGQRGTALINRVIKENFKKKGNGYTIEVKQIKGGKKVIIPVLPKTEEIYRTGLPYKVSNQKLNKHFKKICKLAGLDEMIMGKKKDEKTNRNVKKLRPKYEYISLHTGRRSFATNHFGKLPNEAIMKVTGHTKLATFMKYVQRENDEHVNKFNELYVKDKKEIKMRVIKKALNE